jgi:hypothetical protein
MMSRGPARALSLLGVDDIGGIGGSGGGDLVVGAGGDDVR